MPQADVSRLPAILTSIPPDRVRRMQRAGAAVWRRFAWLSHPELHRLAVRELRGNVEQIEYMRKWEDPYGQRGRPWLRPLQPGGWRGDAFSSVMDWLRHKLQQRARRGEGGTAAAAAAALGERGEQAVLPKQQGQQAQAQHQHQLAGPSIGDDDAGGGPGMEE